MTNKKHLKYIRHLVCQQVVCDGAIYQSLKTLDLEDSDEPYFIPPGEKQRHSIIKKVLEEKDSSYKVVQDIFSNTNLPPLEPNYLLYRCLVEVLELIEMGSNNIERLGELKELANEKGDKIRDEIYKITGIEHSSEIIRLVKTFVLELGNLDKDENYFVAKFLSKKFDFRSCDTIEQNLKDAGLKKTYSLLYKIAFDPWGANQAVLTMIKGIINQIFGNRINGIFSKIVSSTPHIFEQFNESDSTPEMIENKPLAREYYSQLFEKILKIEWSKLQYQAQILLKTYE